MNKEIAGPPPMDATWWDDYEKLYYEMANLHYRVMEKQDGTYSIDEIAHVGMFMGMTSRIRDAFRIRNENKEAEGEGMQERFIELHHWYLINNQPIHVSRIEARYDEEHTITIEGIQAKDYAAYVSYQHIGEQQPPYRTVAKLHNIPEPERIRVVIYPDTPWQEITEYEALKRQEVELERRVKHFGLPTFPILVGMFIGNRDPHELEWIIEHGSIQYESFKIEKVRCRYHLLQEGNLVKSVPTLDALLTEDVKNTLCYWQWFPNLYG